MTDEAKTPAGDPDLVILTFMRGYSPYNAGEQAGFLGDRAAPLIRAGIAVYVSGPMTPVIQSAIDAAPGGSGAAAPSAGEGEGAGGAGAGTGGALATATHALNSTDAVAYVKTLTTKADVDGARAGEEAHPKYTGGRKSVLDALDDRELEILEEAQKAAELAAGGAGAGTGGANS